MDFLFLTLYSLENMDTIHSFLINFVHKLAWDEKAADRKKIWNLIGNITEEDHEIIKTLVLDLKSCKEGNKTGIRIGQKEADLLFRYVMKLEMTLYEETNRPRSFL